jgi:hypothetical protein
VSADPGILVSQRRYCSQRIIPKRCFGRILLFRNTAIANGDRARKDVT